MDIDQLVAKTQKRLFVSLVTHAVLVTPECLKRKQYKSSFELRFFLHPPNPEHIIQAWKRGSQELEPCAPEEFLAMCKERRKSRLLFCFLEEGNLVYLTWAYKLQGFSRGGSGGTEAYIWTPSGWESVSAPGCGRWIS
ncbi:MAG TPA: hypothetical protein PLU80_21875 [Acidobacteriota bacterium]|nr:hypothetical protein [Acidobacteriota bacterium]